MLRGGLSCNELYGPIHDLAKTGTDLIHYVLVLRVLRDSVVI